jgi:peroxiredoxin
MSSSTPPSTGTSTDNSTNTPTTPPSGPKGLRAAWKPLAALALLAVSAWMTWAWQGSPKQAPRFSYTTLEGRQANSESLRGQVVLVNFWATSCTTCVAEMPDLVATHQKYQAKGLQTLAVAMSYDPPSFVLGFAQSKQLPFTVVMDNTGSIAQAFGDVKLTPTTFLLNKRGEVVKRYVGKPDFEAVHRLIEGLMQEG